MLAATPLRLLPLALLTVLLAAIALWVGPSNLGPARIAASLGIGAAAPLAPYEWAVLTDIRLPRVLLGLLVGAALAQAGAAMQGLFRNPLAEPGVVGVSGGAALAAVCSLVIGLPSALPLPTGLLLPAAAFLGGWLATLSVMSLARVDGSLRMATLLLAGMAINALTSAGIGFLAHTADATALRTLTFWLFGSLGRASWPELAWTAPLLCLPLLWLPRRARALNALLLGEAEAQHLGVSVERLKREIALLSVLAVATSVAATGVIAFVGLIVPHLLRLRHGPDHRLLLPGAALGGACLLTAADLLARILMAPAELPIGVLTALLGGPFFLWLLARGQDREALT